MADTNYDKHATSPSVGKPSEDRLVGRYVSDLLQSAASRDRAKETIKTLLLVVPLTLLIWVYAERSQSTEDKVTVSLEIESSDPQQAALLVHANGDDVSNIPSVTLTLEGPRSRIVAVKSEITRLSREGKLKLFVPSQLGVGRDHDVPIGAMAGNNAPFLDSGVTVKATEPDAITVKIDKIESRDVSVQLPRELAQLVTQPRLEPATVRVRGPVSMLQKAFARPEGFAATLDLSSAALGQAGSRVFDSVALLPPGDPTLSFTPNTIKVVLEVNPLEPKFTIPSMSISVQKPLNMDSRYRIEVTPIILTNVSVVGPQDKIDLIRLDKASPRPTAVLVVTTEDIGKDGRHAVRYDLPPGVRAVDTPREVEFRIVEVGGPP